MNNYIENLKNLAKKKDYDDEYIELCVGYAERLIENGLPVVFDIQHIVLLTGVEKKFLLSLVFNTQFFYNELKIPKKTGGLRVLNIPSVELKYIQRWILDEILKKIKVSPFATGFCNGKSIVDNAKIHIGQKCILNMDMENFFPSINFEQVFRVFKYYGYTKEVSFVLARLCTYENALPQGSPASPYLSNIISLKLDKRLSGLSKSYQANYSRYADDITFSGNDGIANLIPIVTEIIEEEGFKVNKKKTRIQKPHQRQEVTGLVVNDGKVKVNKKYKRDLYNSIYYCTKFGVESHLNQINCNKAFFKEHMYGKAYFINMVEPEEGKKIFQMLDGIQWSY